MPPHEPPPPAPRSGPTRGSDRLIGKFLLLYLAVTTLLGIAVAVAPQYL